MTNSSRPIFFFNDTATTEIYPLSLHDALPIYATVLEDHDRGRTLAQFLDRPAVGEVATVGVLHEEARVERSDQCLGACRSDRCVVPVGAAAGDHRAGVQLSRQEIRVHPHDADDVTRVHRVGTHERLVYRGDTVGGRAPGNVPHALTG